MPASRSRGRSCRHEYAGWGPAPVPWPRRSPPSIHGDACRVRRPRLRSSAAALGSEAGGWAGADRARRRGRRAHPAGHHRAVDRGTRSSSRRRPSPCSPWRRTGGCPGRGRAPHDPDRRQPVAEIRAAAERESARLVWLCTPNNPTGDRYPVDEVRALAEACPPRLCRRGVSRVRGGLHRRGARVDVGRRAPGRAAEPARAALPREVAWAGGRSRGLPGRAGPARRSVRRGPAAALGRRAIGGARPRRAGRRGGGARSPSSRSSRRAIGSRPRCAARVRALPSVTNFVAFRPERQMRPPWTRRCWLVAWRSADTGGPDGGLAARDRTAGTRGVAPAAGARGGAGMTRIGAAERSTAETTIRVRVDLDGTGRAEVTTPIGFLDHLLTLLRAARPDRPRGRRQRRRPRRRAPHRRGHGARPGPGHRRGAR